MWTKIVDFFGGIPWLQVGIISALVGTLVYGFHLIGENAVLKQVNVQLQSSIKEQYSTDQKTISELKAQSASDLAAVQKDYDEKVQQLQQTTQQLEAIQNAPSTDDGPVAPVLKRTLDSMRNTDSGVQH